MLVKLMKNLTERIDGDYIVYRFPHRRVLGYMLSYLRSWWWPEWLDGDPPFWPRHSWNALAIEWWRLLVHGSREYRFD